MVLGCHLISPRDPRETHGAPGAPSRRCMPMWTPAAESWSRQGLWRWSTEPISRRCSHGSRSVLKSPAGWCPMIEGFEHCSNVPWLLFFLWLLSWEWQHHFSRFSPNQQLASDKFHRWKPCTASMRSWWSWMRTSKLPMLRRSRAFRRRSRHGAMEDFWHLDGFKMDFASGFRMDLGWNLAWIQDRYLPTMGRLNKFIWIHVICLSWVQHSRGLGDIAGSGDIYDILWRLTQKNKGYDIKPTIDFKGLRLTLKTKVGLNKFGGVMKRDYWYHEVL